MPVPAASGAGGGSVIGGASATSGGAIGGASVAAFLAIGSAPGARSQGVHTGPDLSTKKKVRFKSRWYFYNLYTILVNNKYRKYERKDWHLMI